MASEGPSEYPAYLETERLTLVLQTPNYKPSPDVAQTIQPLPKAKFLDFHLALINHPKAVEGMGDMGIRNRDTYEKILEGTSVPSFRYPGEEQDSSWSGIWNIYITSDKELGPIGSITLGQRQVSGSLNGKPFAPDLGWGIFPEYWRKGYSTEAASLLLTYLLENTHLKFVVALPSPDNAASVGVAKKIGMRDWGRVKAEAGGETDKAALYGAVLEGAEAEADDMVQSWGKDLIVHIFPRGTKTDV